MRVVPTVDDGNLVARRQVNRVPWNKGLKGHACKNPETCYHKIKSARMKRPGQSEAMKRAYAEKPGLVEVRRQQMTERWKLGVDEQGQD